MLRLLLWVAILTMVAPYLIVTVAALYFGATTHGMG